MLTASGENALPPVLPRTLPLLLLIRWCCCSSSSYFWWLVVVVVAAAADVLAFSVVVAVAAELAADGKNELVMFVSDRFSRLASEATVEGDGSGGGAAEAEGGVNDEAVQAM